MKQMFKKDIFSPYQDLTGLQRRLAQRCPCLRKSQGRTGVWEDLPGLRLLAILINVFIYDFS